MGHVFGTPKVGPSGQIEAEILIGDKAAIDFVENVSDEVSIGYDAKLG